ncbi:hypothetical protein L209DRAFT_33671 [Thermothelomyces heterothallicus CBS 203.75]
MCCSGYKRLTMLSFIDNIWAPSSLFISLLFQKHHTRSTDDSQHTSHLRGLYTTAATTRSLDDLEGLNISAGSMSTSRKKIVTFKVVTCSSLASDTSHPAASRSTIASRTSSESASFETAPRTAASKNTTGPLARRNAAQADNSKNTSRPAASRLTALPFASNHKPRSASFQDTTRGGYSSGYTTHGSTSHTQRSSSGSRNQPESSKSQENAGKSNSTHRESISSGNSDKKSKNIIPPPEQEGKVEHTGTQKFSIVIYKGAPHDSYDKRHIALFIEYFDQSGDPWGTDLIDIHGIVTRWALGHTENRGSSSKNGKSTSTQQADPGEDCATTSLIRASIMMTWSSTAKSGWRMP